MVLLRLFNYQGALTVRYHRQCSFYRRRLFAAYKIRILEHKNERGQAAETIVDQIVSEQKIDVDAISGATNSSKVIKKAVENALENGLQ